MCRGLFEYVVDAVSQLPLLLPLSNLSNLSRLAPVEEPEMVMSRRQINLPRSKPVITFIASASVFRLHTPEKGRQWMNFGISWRRE